MSFMRRIWSAIRNPVRYVGRDLEGNKYFEARSLNDPNRTKRSVQYYDPEVVWNYIGGGKRLPVQWSSWLTHTRRHPPTIEELESDLARQRRVLANAAMIEAKDRAETEEMQRLRQRDAHLAVEDALVNRAERLFPESEPANRPEQNTNPPLQETVKILPPKFVTPATPKKLKSSKPFLVPSLDSLNLQHEAMDQPSRPVDKKDASDLNLRPVKDIFLGKTTSLETESWAPKARKRG